MHTGSYKEFCKAIRAMTEGESVSYTDFTGRVHQRGDGPNTPEYEAYLADMGDEAATGKLAAV